MSQILSIDLNSEQALRPYKDVDIGVAARKGLRISNVSELRKLECQKGCLDFLKHTTMKLIERSPLKYQLVRTVSCLAPSVILHSRAVTEHRMNNTLQLLFDENYVTACTADKVGNQFSEFCEDAHSTYRTKFDYFSVAKDRLDIFYRDLLRKGEVVKYEELWKVIKLLLILSHGNASVESGFSVNEDMLVENLHEESLIGLRQVYDAVKNYGGVLSVNINKTMISYVRGASRVYTEAAAAKRKTLNKSEKEHNMKTLAGQIQVLEERKRNLLCDSSAEVRSLEKKIKKLKSSM